MAFPRAVHQPQSFRVGGAFRKVQLLVNHCEVPVVMYQAAARSHLRINADPEINLVCQSSGTLKAGRCHPAWGSLEGALNRLRRRGRRAAEQQQSAQRAGNPPVRTRPPVPGPFNTTLLHRHIPSFIHVVNPWGWKPSPRPGLYHPWQAPPRVLMPPRRCGPEQAIHVSSNLTQKPPRSPAKARK